MATRWLACRRPASPATPLTSHALRSALLRSATFSRLSTQSASSRFSTKSTTSRFSTKSTTSRFSTKRSSRPAIRCANPPFPSLQPSSLPSIVLSEVPPFQSRLPFPISARRWASSKDQDPDQDPDQSPDPSPSDLSASTRTDGHDSESISTHKTSDVPPQTNVETPAVDINSEAPSETQAERESDHNLDGAESSEQTPSAEIPADEDSLLDAYFAEPPQSAQSDALGDPDRPLSSSHVPTFDPSASSTRSESGWASDPSSSTERASTAEAEEAQEISSSEQDLYDQPTMDSPADLPDINAAPPIDIAAAGPIDQTASSSTEGQGAEETVKMSVASEVTPAQPISNTTDAPLESSEELQLAMSQFSRLNLQDDETAQISASIAEQILADLPPFLHDNGSLPDPRLPQRSLTNARLVPASQAYYSAVPRQIDDAVEIERLHRATLMLPRIPAEAPDPLLWRTPRQYRVHVHEPVPTRRYRIMREQLTSMSRIIPFVIPPAVRSVLGQHAVGSTSTTSRRNIRAVDKFGRGWGVGRRKTSSARVYVVPGEGIIRVNGRSLTNFFPRLYDRQSAVWALLVTGRAARYNVWSLVKGGGTTGQAESMAVALAQGLEVLEPSLGPALMQAGLMTRDLRQVERKKPGRLKARKRPTWVKR